MRGEQLDLGSGAAEALEAVQVAELVRWLPKVMRARGRSLDRPPCHVTASSDVEAWELGLRVWEGLGLPTCGPARHARCLRDVGRVAQRRGRLQAGRMAAELARSWVEAGGEAWRATWLAWRGAGRGPRPGEARELAEELADVVRLYRGLRPMEWVTVREAVELLGAAVAERCAVSEARGAGRARRPAAGGRPAGEGI